ncbi:MAG: hypothetical protein V4515_12670 [Chloroflexota bacterium]
MTALVLLPIATGLFVAGGLIFAPLAYRRGVNAGKAHTADITAWGLPAYPVQVGRHAMTARESRARYWAQLRAWWASTAPRDVHAPVERALARQAQVRQAIGRPPAQLVRRAA